MSKSYAPYGDLAEQISEAEAYRIMRASELRLVMCRYEHDDHCQAPSGKPCTCNPVITYWLYKGGEA